jgi:8-oxo-dGTP pyrophosphatase MutT (NUDIX family)
MPASVFGPQCSGDMAGAKVSEQRRQAGCIGLCPSGWPDRLACPYCTALTTAPGVWPDTSNDGLGTVRPYLEALPELPALGRVLHRLDRVPQGIGWNHAQLADLLPSQPPVQAAVLVGLVPRAEGTQVILTRRTETLRSHAGQVGFPGGRIEAVDGHPAVAALRESNEEIALLPEQAVALGFLDPFITITNYRVLPLVAVIDPAFVPVPSPDEVAEVFEVPLAYLMHMGNLRAKPVDWGGNTRSVLEYDWPGQRIWGATAAMLANLHQRLQQA